VLITAVQHLIVTPSAVQPLLDSISHLRRWTTHILSTIAIRELVWDSEYETIIGFPGSLCKALYSHFLIWWRGRELLF
jgi:hypothetical protein